MDNDEESRPMATRSRGNRPEETPALSTSSNTSLSNNVNVQEHEISLTPAALESIITAAIATAMSQSPTNRALFVNDNASGGVNIDRKSVV